MAQYWELINIDKRARLRRSASNFWEFLRFTPTEQLVGLLKKSHWIRFRISAKYIHAAKAKATKSRLIRLPQEIIDHIICYVAAARGGGVDVICLALTCAYFFRLLATSIQTTMRNDCGPWAGDRLVFAGDAGGRGLPCDLRELLPSDHLVAVAAEGKLARRSCSSFDRYERYPADIYGKLGRAVKERLRRETGSFRRFKRLAKLLTTEPHHIVHGDRTPVLRNLTTREYVRDTALAQSEYAYSLGEVVMVQTIWTQDPKDVWRLGMEARWRGHRFDISVMEDVTGDEWTDVSHEAVERMALAATEQFRKGNGRRVQWYKEF